MPNRNRWIRGYGTVISGITAVVLLLASAAGGANLTDVRVGIHKDFSRVVLQLDGVSPYRLVGLEPRPAGGMLLIIALDAGPIDVSPIQPAKSRHIQALGVRGGDAGGSQVRIRLRGDAEMKELVLRNPDRIVFDFYDAGAGVASLVSGLVASANIAQAPIESGEFAAVNQPFATEPAIDPAEQLAEAPLEGVDELSETIGEDPTEGFEEGGGELLEAEVLGAVPEELEPAAPQEDAFAGAEIGEVVAEPPRAELPPGAIPPSLDDPSAEGSGSLLGNPLVLAGLAGLAVIALVFVLGSRRRRSTADALSPLDAEEEAEPDSADREIGAAEESALSPAGEHDIEPDAVRVGAEVETTATEGTGMSHEADYPAPAAAGGGLPTSSLAGAGPNDVGIGEVAKLVEEFDRRIAHLENRLEEVVDAKERLERQVSAQTEELRVQRAAIARTQRVLRTLARPDEEASEPAPKVKV